MEVQDRGRGCFGFLLGVGLWNLHIWETKCDRHSTRENDVANSNVVTNEMGMVAWMINRSSSIKCLHRALHILTRRLMCLRSEYQKTTSLSC